MSWLKLTGLLVAALTAGLAGGVWIARSPAGDRRASTKRAAIKYACPMHPQYVSDKPGTAPCCGMRLEPIGDHANGAVASANGQPAGLAGAVTVTPEQQRLIGVRTGVVTKTNIPGVIRTTGRVSADERLVYRINTSASGWIRETYSNTVGSLVKKNEALATFYTREFLSAQQAYFYALDALDRFTRAKSSEAQLASTRAQVQAAVDSLQSLGMSETQIAELGRVRKQTQHIELRAPIAGFVLIRNVSPGQRFNSGEVLYVVADLSRVWVLTDLFLRDAKYVRPGQSATIHLPEQSRTFRGRVSEILPQFDSSSRTLKVRIELANPDYVLRPDMFVDVTLSIDPAAGLSVPADAVVNSGMKKIVYVDRGEGRFEPREVECGRHFGDEVEIAHGVAAGERIVLSGTFLVDSESRMKLAASAAEKRTEPAEAASGIDPVCGMSVAVTTPLRNQYRGKTFYFCSRSCKEISKTLLRSMR